MYHPSWNYHGFSVKTSLLSVLKWQREEWMNPFLINANVSIWWYLSSRLHQLVNLADHRCTSPETTSTCQSGWPPNVRLWAKVWKDIGLERQPIPTSRHWQQLTLKSIKTWSWKAWTGKDSVHQQETESPSQPRWLLMLQKSTPRTWTLRDMVLKGISYEDHSMLHLRLHNKLWVVLEYPTRGH